MVMLIYACLAVAHHRVMEQSVSTAGTSALLLSYREHSWSSHTT